MTQYVIYQVYLEICITYYTIGHIPGIYHGYLTSTDSRWFQRKVKFLERAAAARAFNLKCTAAVTGPSLIPLGMRDGKPHLDCAPLRLAPSEPESHPGA